MNVMLSVKMLIIVMLSVIMLCDIKLSVILLSVMMPNVMAPFIKLRGTCHTYLMTAAKVMLCFDNCHFHRYCYSECC